MAGTRYTVEELLALIRHSKLANVVVEGRHDVALLRSIESAMRERVPDIDFIDAGDKEAVIRTWEKRDEAVPARVAFLADSDLWLFTSDRLQYPSVVFTDGYSLENYCVASPHVQRLVTAIPTTASVWNSALRSLVDWFSAEVAIKQEGGECLLDRGTENLLNTADFSLTAEAATRVAAANPHRRAELEVAIGANPNHLIPGKVLILTIKAVLHQCEQLPANRKFLLAMGAKLDNPGLQQLADRIVSSLGPSGNADVV